MHGSNFHTSKEGADYPPYATIARGFDVEASRSVQVQPVTKVRVAEEKLFTRVQRMWYSASSEAWKIPRTETHHEVDPTPEEISSRDI